MRALREQPRVTVAKIMVFVALIAMGAVVGATLDGAGGDRVRATQARLASARQSLTATEVELRVARGRIERGSRALDRARQDARVLARENRRLRRELRGAQRARRQARRQR